VALRFRNQVTYSDPDTRPSIRPPQSDAPTFVSGLTVEAMGYAEGREKAVSVLGRAIAGYLPLVAVAANAAVHSPDETFAYALPTPEDTGRYFFRRQTPRAHPAKLRTLPGSDMIRLVQPYENIRENQRILRAIHHHQLALASLNQMGPAIAAESLWIAVENLTDVILTRLRAENGLSQDPRGKHELALLLGFTPRDSKDRSHLDDLDGHLRKEVVFKGDATCYRSVKELSDGLEHGYMPFDDVLHRATGTTDGFGYVRAALLTEIGLRNDDPLLGDEFNTPLSDWLPVMETEAMYAPALIENDDRGSDDSLREWPEFIGPVRVPTVTRVVDDRDGKRHLTREVHREIATWSANRSNTESPIRLVQPFGEDNVALGPTGADSGPGAGAVD